MEPRHGCSGGQDEGLSAESELWEDRGLMSGWFLDLMVLGQLFPRDGVVLPLKEQISSLGVLTGPSLSLEAQVTSVARSACYQL